MRETGWNVSMPYSAAQVHKPGEQLVYVYTGLYLKIIFPFWGVTICPSLHHLSIYQCMCVCEHTFINTQTNLDFYICNLIKKNLKNSGEIFTTFFHSGFNFSQTELLGNFVSRYNRVAFQQWMEQVLPATVQCPLIDGGHCRQSLPSLGFHVVALKSSCLSPWLSSTQIIVLYADTQHGQREPLSSSCEGQPSPLPKEWAAFSVSPVPQKPAGHRVDSMP